MARSNKIVVQGARQALDQMKNETASELGIINYSSMDKGDLSSRQNGYVGGYMTKKLISYAEQQLAGGSK